MKLLERWATRTLKHKGYDVVRGNAQRPEPRPKPKPEFPEDAFEAQRAMLKVLGRGESPTILDVGANRGQTATRYRSVFPNADIVCFEPFPESMEILQQTHADDHKVRTVPLAVGRESGTATFHVNQTSGTNSLFPRPSSSRRYYETKSAPVTTIEVRVTTLDSFLSEQNLTSIDILKFDIQGGELNALRGAQSTLESGGFALIYTEAFFVPHYEGAPLFHEISSFLNDFGYTLFDLYDLKKARNGQLRFCDALFVSSQVRRDVIDRFTEER